MKRVLGPVKLSWQQKKKQLIDRRAAKSHLSKLYADKAHKFCTDEIIELHEKYQKFIDINGQYVID